MKITIDNLGVVRHIEFDTQKPLSLFCGPNSTGKTYVSYVLYSVMNFSEWYFSANSNMVVSDMFSNEIDFLSHIKPNAEYDLSEFISGVYKGFSLYIPHLIKKHIGDIFGISDELMEDLFKQFHFNISVFPSEFNVDYVKDVCVWSKRNNKFYIKFPESIDTSLAIYVLLSNLFCNVLILPVERNSIYTFKTELSLNRYDLVNRLNALKDKSNVKLSKILQSNSRRYPLSVSDCLKVANDLDNIKKNRGDYFDFAVNLENSLLHGKVEVSSTGDVEFIVGENVHLPIQVSSSIVKTLSSLILYLKYIVKKGDTIIIDEPEMNLHPDNQILLARIFAQMVNMGIKLVISTHSDYIIRELNNLIMANELKLRGNNIWQDYGYSEDMLLNCEKVSVKYFKPNKESEMVDVNDIEVNSYGFAIDSIDDAITLQNDISNEFGNTLNYDYGV